MSKHTLWALAFSFFLGAPVFAKTSTVSDESEAPKLVRFGFFPAGDSEKLKLEAKSFAEEMQNKLNLPVEVFIAKDYASLTRAMSQNKVDFAFLTPAVYVDLDAQKRVKVLLKKVWATDSYYSILATRSDSKFSSLTQMKGARLAFIDRQSTSGYLYPSRFLVRQNKKPQDFAAIEFLGSHKASVEALDAGRVDVISVFSDDATAKVSALSHYGKKKRQEYRILWTSDPIPNDPFCVHQDFYKKFSRSTHDVMFALIELAEDNVKNPRWSEVLGARSLVPATSRHYENVRRLIREPEFM